MYVQRAYQTVMLCALVYTGTQLRNTLFALYSAFLFNIILYFSFLKREYENYEHFWERKIYRIHVLRIRRTSAGEVRENEKLSYEFNCCVMVCVEHRSLSLSYHVENVAVPNIGYALVQGYLHVYIYHCIKCAYSLSLARSLGSYSYIRSQQLVCATHFQLNTIYTEFGAVQLR